MSSMLQGLKRAFTAFSALIATVVVASGQTQPRPPFDAFEVATAKPIGPNPAGRWIRMQSANRF
jgi:hypothetical protein